VNDNVLALAPALVRALAPALARALAPALARALAAALALPLAGLTACSASPGAAADGSKFFAAPTGVADVSSNTDVERYFPLIDGTIFNYATENEAGDRGILIARVHRTDATHGELVFPTGKKRFVYSREGVRIEPTGDFVLAAPLTQGATFRGQNGGRARLEDTALVIDVRAGSYQNCVRVAEERGGDRPARFTTTFCPNVGIVVIEAQAGGSYERAELVSAGPPVNLERDGVSVERGAPPP